MGSGRRAAWHAETFDDFRVWRQIKLCDGGLAIRIWLPRVTANTRTIALIKLDGGEGLPARFMKTSTPSNGLLLNRSGLQRCLDTKLKSVSVAGS
jgi:hypothetical protein